MASSAALARKTCPRCGGTFEVEAAFCPTDGTKLESAATLDPNRDAYIGTTVHGDIDIQTVAGSGAMGKVYRAHQRSIERDVAVKILHRELSGNTTLVQRFHREAKIASKLQHPHVVEIYLAGQLPDGALYIAMEYLDGMSLAAALAAGGGSMPLDRALPIILQICDAVGAGHARGIVHRDLKPENVMLVRRAETADWVKVLDFGIAKVSLGEQSMETAAGLIFGTARYISPEGAQGSTVTPPSDVYSIAVMAYQLLAGKTPFDAEQPVGLLVKHIHDAPPLLKSHPAAANVPDAIAKVVMDNLAKEPARRAQTARALGNAFAAAAREAGVAIADVGVVARMSIGDLGVARSSQPLEPTLDDAAAVPAIVVPLRLEPTPTGRSPLVPTPLPLTDRSPLPAIVPPATPHSGHMAIARPPSGVDATEFASEPPPKAVASSAPASRPEPRRRSFAVVVLAFLLGAALAALVTQQIANHRNTERDAFVEKTRRALAAGRYVSPEGDNVRDLVALGQKKWPNDVVFTRVASEASHELVTRAMAARSAGDLVQARDLVKTALEFDASDRAAQLLLKQYDEELGLTGTSAPRVLLDVPIGRARPGARVELVARLSLNGGPPRNEVDNPHFTVEGPGLPSGGTKFPAIASEPGKFVALVVPPREGNYEVVFEAHADGVPFHAERTFDVTR